MKIGLALAELHRSENNLARKLLHISERHKVDHEIYHLGQDLARWSQRHVRELAEIAPQFGQQLDPEPAGEHPLRQKLRERSSDLLGRDSKVGLLLLVDLRETYTMAAGVSADWEMLGQAAQGIKHADLLALTKRCHPDNLRQMRWANGKLKESSTQVLVS
ncbi:hypothetical protein ACFQRD_15320 [Brachybacterium sp. GCM10030268]|uniref:hypothetical protein n=1 Tax=Brachybacterium sp. GCM10030268 TaxID=3273382 RepID=UPI0036165F7D